MELLQTITKLYNSEADCPAEIRVCELLYDAERVRMLLKLRLNPKKGQTAHDMYIDVCCYDKDGQRLSVMKNIPYSERGMLITLPSLMTASAEVILRRTEQNGKAWISGAEFPDALNTSGNIGGGISETDFAETAKSAGEGGSRTVKSGRAQRRSERKMRIAEEEEIRRIIKTDPTERKKRAAKRIISVLVIAGLCCGGVKAFRYKNAADAVYQNAMNLYNSGRFEESIPLFEEAEGYKFFGDKKAELDWCIAMSYCRQRQFDKAAPYFYAGKGYKESMANFKSIIEAYTGIISAGGAHTIGLKNDGSVLAAGDNSKGQCNVSDWYDITKIAAGGAHSVGIKRDKTVIAAGDNSKGQCGVDNWRNIIDISAGSAHTVGVENVGRVTAAGDNTYGQCDVKDWSGISSVSAGSQHTVGLKLDGTVIAAGDNSHGECNVSGWTGIVLVAAGDGFTAGLKYDGTVVTAGLDNADGTAKAKDLSSIAAGGKTLLMTSGGKTSAVGDNSANQGMTSLWKDIVAASCGSRHSVGICADGTVFASGDNGSGQISLNSWKNIGIPKDTVTIYKGE